jgi:ribosomal protein L29
MAIVKKKDLKAMSASEMKAKLEEIEKELMTTRFEAKQGTGKPQNAGRFRALKRLRARIKTFLSAKGVKQ